MSAAPHQGCDRAIAAAATSASAGTSRATAAAAHPRIVLATTILASSLAFIDGSVVNVGLPAIGRSLNADGGYSRGSSTATCCRSAPCCYWEVRLATALAGAASWYSA